jgi:hypothetical protein
MRPLRRRRLGRRGRRLDMRSIEDSSGDGTALHWGIERGEKMRGDGLLSSLLPCCYDNWGM